MDEPEAFEPRLGVIVLAWPDTLVMSRDVDFAAVRCFGAVDRLDGVHLVDLSAATYLDTSAVGLLLRCVQLTRQRDPTRRVQVLGGTERVRASLQMRGVEHLVDFVDLEE